MNERGGRKSVHGGSYDKITGLTTIFRCVTFDDLFLGEKLHYGVGMMLIWYKTNLGVGNTMAPSKIAKYVIIKVLLTIVGSWRWGPYRIPDLWR